MTTSDKAGVQAQAQGQPLSGQAGVRGAADKQEAVKQNRLSCGLDILDRTLNGGIPKGSMVYFTAEPITQPEIFLFEFTAPRKTFYFSTDKSPANIERHMSELNYSYERIEFFDIREEFYSNILVTSSEAGEAERRLIEHIDAQIDAIYTSGESNFTIIFDNFSFLIDLGIDVHTLKSLLHKIYEMDKERESTCVLLLLKGIHDRRIETIFQNVCDVIFDIDVEKKGDKIGFKLSIPKVRGINPVTEYIRFKVQDRIYIDTSRDIA